ncbi:type I polyketide synthase [Chryseobacterium sp.]|uniref:type I polyketide synthase n=2 Tax=Pseudomonadati TaxID=3379134 RepID=UPI001B1EE5C7|nr:type I polyketide synthase [Chryseobacterium sp.]MBO9691674.1 SDR family NAD(P)-dependent oxidoreductase [Chryseobacterium sp.]
MKQKKIAIIGIGCRYAGNITNAESFWNQLKNCKDAVTDVPADRWNLDKFYDQNEDAPGKMYTKRGAFLKESIYDFDYNFFGISARESMTLDPQQKLLLEIAYEAFDDAGLDIHLLKKTKTGVFIGGFMLDNLLLRTSGDTLRYINTHTPTAGTATLLSNRLSHTFDLMGPSFSVDTACSSSMVAVHLACQAIKNNETELAIAGGVNIMINPVASILMSKGKYLAKDGRSKAFFEQADGYGRGEGAGMIVLKELDKAIEDNDIIYAVIESTAINQDGRTEGISLPNQEAQINVIKDALKAGNIPASSIDYIEAHGTGTKAGDPIELGALGSIYGKDRIAPLPVGSVKINIGHTEAASGIAGIIKAALVLKNKEILPHMNLGPLATNIPFEQLNINIPLQGDSWYSTTRPAYAAVNSFGYGGTNGHAILSGFDPISVPVPKEQPQSYQFVISGKSLKSLKENASNLLQFLEDKKDISLSNLAYTLTRRKTIHEFAWLLEAESQEELIYALELKLQKEEYPKASATNDQRLVWVFTGMGPQWYDMGKELYNENTIFRDTLNKCDALYSAVAGYSLLAEMQKPEALSQITKNYLAQPANFFIQIGLSEMLASKGVHPDAIIGHSVGEVAAAVVAKAITLEDGVRMVYQRGRILQKIAGKGTLLSVGLSFEKATHYLQSFPDLEIATINSPQSLTIAGTENDLSLLDRKLTIDGVFSKLVRVEVAYHSSQAEILKDESMEAFSFVKPALPTIPLYSTVTAELVDSVIHNADYWWMNIRYEVFFSQALGKLIQQGYTNFMEIGPHPVLGGSIREIAAETGTRVNTFFTLKRHTEENASINTNIEGLIGAGIKVELNAGLKAQVIRLPAYAWDKEYCWTQAAEISNYLTGENNPNPFLQEKLEGPDICWKTQVNRPALSYLKDHQIGNSIIFPGAGYIESILSVLSTKSNSGTFIIEFIEFISPLSFREGEFPELFTALNADGAYSISSKINDNWTVHSKGIAWTSDKFVPLPAKDIYALLLFPDVFSKTDAYNYFASIGLNYQAAFQTISSYSFFNGNEIFSVLQNTTTETSDAQSILHPTILDGAFQSLLLLSANTHPGKTYLPVKIDSIKVFASLPSTVYCIAQITEENATHLSGNLQLLDQNGNILVDLQGLFCKKAQVNSDISQQQNWIYKYSFAPYQLSGNNDFVNIPLLATGDYSVFNSLSFPPAFPVEFVPISELDSIENKEFQLLYLASGGEKNSETDSSADYHQLITLLQHQGVKKHLKRLLLLTQYGLADETVPVVEKINPHHTALAGFARVVAIEAPDIQLKTVDIQSPLNENELQTLLQSSFEEEELIYTQSGWNQGKLVLDDVSFPQRAKSAAKKEPGQAFSFNILQKGKIDSLVFRNIEIENPGIHEVQIEVAASSLNFKDAMKAMGLLNEAALENTLFGTHFGMEGAGIITRLHPSVTEFKVGDRVYFNGNGLRTHINVHRDFVHKLPDHISFQESSTFLVYLTAWITLIELGHLQKGERILIHAAAGGVGLAACNIALSKGAKVFATAGTDEKRALLKKLGIEHIYDSRSLNFYDEILRDTNGEGVDMVLNSLAGPALYRSLRLIRTAGRFIEIGKQDITTNNKLSLLPFNKSIQFIAFDLDKSILISPHRFRDFFDNFLQAYSEKQLPPLPYEVFMAGQSREAFKKLASGTYSGKAVIDFTDQTLETVPEVKEELSFKEGESVLITGGCSGFGLRTALWFAEQGVKHLILASRKGQIAHEEKQIQEKIESYGCTVYPLQLDVTDEYSVKSAVRFSAEKDLHLIGIIHAAAVLEDCLVETITPAVFDKVFLPKAQGALYLHEQTKDIPLKFFVCYSSGLSYTGNPGQLAYVTANSFLDGLALDRIRQGLPATSISWGAIAETGMVARTKMAQTHLNNIGFKLISPVFGLNIMGDALKNFQNHIGIIDVDWNTMTDSLPGSWKRLSGLLAKQQHESSSPFVRHLFTMEETKWDDTMIEGIKDLIAEITGGNKDVLTPDTKLTDLGFDSIMSVELVVAIQSKMSINLSIMEILGATTIVQLAQITKAKILIHKSTLK